MEDVHVLMFVLMSDADTNTWNYNELCYFYQIINTVDVCMW